VSAEIEWVPAFHGQRPPFLPGNQWRREPGNKLGFAEGNELATTHGAYSSRRTDPIAQRFVDEIREDPSTEYLTQPRFQASLWAWAVTQSRVELISQWVDRMDFDVAARSDRGQTSPLELLRKWMSTAQTQSARLGLDPLSAARLGKDVSQGRQADVATELTKLRAEHYAAQQGAGK
jgi:hypothetical protein